MIVKILVPFADKDNFARKYSAGEVCEIADSRAKELIERGLVAPEGDLDDADFELVKAHVEKKSEELEALKVKLDGRETDLNLREDNLKVRETELTTREKTFKEEVERAELDLTNRFKALEERESALAKKEAVGTAEKAEPNPLASYERETLIEGLNAIGISTPKNIGDVKLAEKLEGLSEDEKTKLKEALEAK